MDNLTALSEAGGLVQQIQDLQHQMKEIQETLCLNQGATNVPCVIVHLSPPRPGLLDEATRIPGTTWAEEMDLSDPPENSDNKQQDRAPNSPVLFCVNFGEFSPGRAPKLGEDLTFNAVVFQHSWLASSQCRTW